MRLKQGMKTLSAMMLVVFLLPIVVAAQNPSFGGKEFRRIWVGGTIPDGASATPSFNELYMTPAGVYIHSYLSPGGIYFVDDGGAGTVVIKNEPPFSGIDGFRVLGWKLDGSLIFSVIDSVLYPCQLYDGNGLSAISSPTREQEQNLASYFDGRMVYMTYSGSTKTRIWYYTEGNPPELWLEDADMPGLAGPLDYDGETLAFSVSLPGGGYELWRRDSSGITNSIIKYGDLMPGEAASVFVGTPAADTVEVDQGKVYMIGAGSGPTTQILFSSSDGVTFDVIAKRFDDVPGLPGITIQSMKLLQVSNGKVWLFITQSNSDNVLYQIVNGVWTRVVGKLDSFDGRTAYNMTVYEHGSLGDGVVIAVGLPSAPGAFDYVDELYTNADLPGFLEGSTGAIMEMIRQLNGDFKIATLGEAGTSNTLQTTSSLTNNLWETVGVPMVADGTNMMEWTVSPTNDVGFFRLIE